MMSDSEPTPTVEFRWRLARRPLAIPDQRVRDPGGPERTARTTTTTNPVRTSPSTTDTSDAGSRRPAAHIAAESRASRCCGSRSDVALSRPPTSASRCDRQPAMEESRNGDRVGSGGDRLRMGPNQWHGSTRVSSGAKGRARTRLPSGGGRRGLLRIGPLGLTRCHEEERGRFERRWLMPVPLGIAYTVPAGRSTDLAVVGHHAHLHVATDDVAEFVGVRMHLPARRSLRPSSRRATSGCPFS